MENGFHRIAGAGLWGRDLLVFDELPSTNIWAVEHIGELAHGDVIQALRQTAGRGRFKRAWAAPGKSCLTLSLVLQQPAAHAFPLPMLTPAAAIGTRNALREFHLEPALKWPNDVLIGDRKIAGLLADDGGRPETLVLGIGINVNVTAPALATMRFPQAATSMAVERNRLFDIELVCRRLLIALEKSLEAAWAGGPPSVAQQWSAADALAGRRVTVTTPTGAATGAYAGMAPDGRLALDDADGKRRLFWSGDVTLAPG